MHKGQTLILFEGHDKAGKTTIARACAEQLHIPYFKYTMEREAFRHGDTRLLTQYAGPFMADFLRQTGASAIFDRSYPSEFVYGGALGRRIDLHMIMELDQFYAQMGAKIVICQKDLTATPDDDLVGREHLREIQTWYQLFTQWTKCETIFINTTAGKTSEQLEQLVPCLREEHDTSV